MAYSAMVRRALISCPGDVLSSDLSVVQRTINRWNGLYGYQIGAVVLPISWGTHAAAQFGKPPQGAINSQLVDDADICISIFASRLGTPTAGAESGTAEEIARIAERGGYVGILRARRDVNLEHIDLDQVQRLEQYLHTLQDKALILPYDNDMDLAAHVDAILVNAVSKDQGRVEGQRSSSVLGAQIWPKLESENHVKSDSRGRVKTSKKWHLVLKNTGQSPAENIRLNYKAKEADPDFPDPWLIFRLLNEEPGTVLAERLAPDGELRLAITLTMASPMCANATVKWQDERGEQENTVTLRLS